MFYENYVRLCNSIGKTPSAVAVEVGIYKSTVSNWKNRGTNPTDATAQKIADYFGVSVDELLGSAPEQTKKPAGEIPDELKDTDYALLNDQNKDLIKAMIATLIKQQFGE